MLITTLLHLFRISRKPETTWIGLWEFMEFASNFWPNVVVAAVQLICRKSHPNKVNAIQFEYQSDTDKIIMRFSQLYSQVGTKLRRLTRCCVKADIVVIFLLMFVTPSSWPVINHRKLICRTMNIVSWLTVVRPKPTAFSNAMDCQHLYQSFSKVCWLTVVWRIVRIRKFTLRCNAMRCNQMQLKRNFRSSIINFYPYKSNILS